MNKWIIIVQIYIASLFGSALFRMDADLTALHTLADTIWQAASNKTTVSAKAIQKAQEQYKKETNLFAKKEILSKFNNRHLLIDRKIIRQCKLSPIKSKKPKSAGKNASVTQAIIEEVNVDKPLIIALEEAEALLPKVEVVTDQGVIIPSISPKLIRKQIFLQSHTFKILVLTAGLPLGIIFSIEKILKTMLIRI